MNHRLEGVAVFVQVVEAGSLVLAADRMRVTRSTVSRTIAKLERRLGTRLFHRTTRRQSLTEDGFAYYKYCLRALSELDAAEAALESGRREPRGRLRVSLPVLFGRHCVAPVLVSMARKHPKLDVELSFSDRAVDLIDEGFDLAVRIGPLPDSTSLSMRSLGVQRLGIGAAPSYLAAHGTPQRVEDFANHQGIMYSHRGEDAPWQILDEEGNPREAQVHACLRLDDLQTMADMAVKGLGLVCLPCWLLEHYVRTGQLAMVAAATRSVSMGIHIIWPQTRYLPSKTRISIDALVAEIPALLSPA
jgi:DNA-binding transcriptional LysR family regulator